MSQDKRLTQVLGVLNDYLWLNIFGFLDHRSVVDFLMIEPFLLELISDTDNAANKQLQVISQQVLLPFFSEKMWALMGGFMGAVTDQDNFYYIIHKYRFALKHYLDKTEARDCIRWKLRLAICDRISESDTLPLDEYNAVGKIILQIDALEARQGLYTILCRLPVFMYLWSRDAISPATSTPREEAQQNITVCLRALIKIAIYAHNMKILQMALEYPDAHAAFRLVNNIDNIAIYRDLIRAIRVMPKGVKDAAWHNISFVNDPGLPGFLVLGVSIPILNIIFLVSRMQKPQSLLSGEFYMLLISQLIGLLAFPMLRKLSTQSFSNFSNFFRALPNLLLSSLLFWLSAFPRDIWRIGKYYWSDMQSEGVRELMTIIQALKKSGIMPPENIHALLAEHGDKPMPDCFVREFTQNSATWFTAAASHNNDPENRASEAAQLSIKKHT